MSVFRLEFHTGDPKTTELCSLYWKVSEWNEDFTYKVSDLASRFGLPPNEVTRIVAQNCTAYSTALFCPRCQRPFHFLSRSEYSEKKRYLSPNWLCEDCQTLSSARVLDFRSAGEQWKRRIINAEFANSERSADFDGIRFDEAIYLLSLIRVAGTDDLEMLLPLTQTKEQFSPTKDLDLEILRQLFGGGYLYIHPASPSDAFEFQNDAIKSFYLDAVSWRVLHGQELKSLPEIVNFIEGTLSKIDRFERWEPEWTMLWKKVALHESIQYLDAVLDAHGFSPLRGEKINAVISSLLDHFSVAQMNNINWRAAKDAAAFLVREGTTREHALNAALFTIQRYGERAVAEGWDIKPYRRDFRCPMSMVSHVLFNSALRIGEDGYFSCPKTFERNQTKHHP